MIDRRALSCVVLVVLLAACLAPGSTPGQAALAADQSSSSGTVTLSIVGTNDLHGGLFARDGRGGLALLGGYVNNLRAVRERDAGAVLLVDAGDMFQGTLESNLNEGAAVIDAYNALGYAAAAIGNHEFDFGPVGPAATPRHADDDPRGALKARAAQAKFPLLAANLLDTVTNRPVDWPNVMPSTMVEAAGIKIGVVGVTTRDTLSATIASNTRGLRIAPLANTIAAHATTLRNEGAVVVIVAAHAGGRCSGFVDTGNLSPCDVRSEIFEVARALSAGLVDVIVAGHMHSPMAYEINGIAVTSAYSGGVAFGRTDLVVDRAARRVTKKQLFGPQDLCEQVMSSTRSCRPTGRGGGRWVPATYEGLPVVPDARIAGVLEPALEAVASLKARPLGPVVDAPMRRQGMPESPLGNFFTDALRAAAPGAHVAIHNVSGGLRADLPPGPLTFGRLYEVFPFDNRIVLLDMTGADLRKLLVADLEEGRSVVGLSGVRVRAACAGRTLSAEIVDLSGRAIEDHDKLVVATTDYLVMGGDSVFAPVTPPQGFSIPDDAPVARDAIAAWLERHGTAVSARAQVDANQPRWSYPGPLPVRCM